MAGPVEPSTPVATRMPAVIVAAGAPVALDVARTLGRRGVEVIGLFPDGPEEPIFAPAVLASRYVHPFFAAPGQLLDALFALGRKLARPSVLIPLGDAEMLMISREREALAPWFRLRLPLHTTIESLLNKDAFAKLAATCGLPIPVSFAVDSGATLRSAATSVRYPCIIKPPWRDVRWRQAHGSRKVCVVRTSGELCSVGSDVLGSFGRCLIQEIVPGPETNIVCTFSFVGEAASSASVAVCRKIRQYPAHFGNTALAECGTDPEAEQLTRDVCRRLDLVGYVSIEFKRDPTSGRLLILEITPGRVNRQVGVTDLAGCSIVAEWYRTLAGLPVDNTPSRRSGLRWASLANDLRALPTYRRSGEWSLWSWLRSYFLVRRFELLSLGDPIPMLVTLAVGLRLLWRRRRKPPGS